MIWQIALGIVLAVILLALLPFILELADGLSVEAVYTLGFAFVIWLVIYALEMPVAAVASVTVVTSGVGLYLVCRWIERRTFFLSDDPMALIVAGYVAIGFATIGSSSWNEDYAVLATSSFLFLIVGWALILRRGIKARRQELAAQGTNRHVSG